MNRKRLAVITSPGLSTGFALAGVPVFESANGREAASQIQRVVAEMNAGVVIIDEPLYDDIPDDLRRALQKSATPVVIPVPGPDWAAGATAHDYIVEILRRAIGYRVRLQ